MFHVTSVNINLAGTGQTLRQDKGQCQLEMQSNIFVILTCGHSNHKVYSQLTKSVVYRIENIIIYYYYFLWLEIYGG